MEEPKFGPSSEYYAPLIILCHCIVNFSFPRPHPPGHYSVPALFITCSLTESSYWRSLVCTFNPHFCPLCLIKLPTAYCTFLVVSVNISKTIHITVSINSKPSKTCGIFAITYFFSVSHFSLHLSQKHQLSLSFTYPLDW